MDHSAHEVYENFPVKLSSNGSVEFIPTLHLESDCIFNYRLFPFEYQMCDFHVSFRPFIYYQQTFQIEYTKCTL